MDAQFIMAREEWETPTGTYEEIQVKTSSGKTKTLTRCVTCKIEIHNTHTLHRHAKGKTHKRKMELVKIATEKVIACEIKRKKQRTTKNRKNLYRVFPLFFPAGELMNPTDNL